MFSSKVSRQTVFAAVLGLACGVNVLAESKAPKAPKAPKISKKDAQYTGVVKGADSARVIHFTDVNGDVYKITISAKTYTAIKTTLAKRIVTGTWTPNQVVRFYDVFGKQVGNVEKSRVSKANRQTVEAFVKAIQARLETK